jgi:hypothetical protein
MVNMRRTAPLLLLLVLPVLLPAQAPTVTFAEQIAPIVHAHCASCHRRGEAAPFPLLSFGDVRKRAKMVRAVVESKLMPPWHPDDDCGPFLEENRLSKEQIETIGRWVDAGMPEGDPAKTPEPPAFPDGWQLGEPDLVVSMKDPFEVRAAGPDIYRNFVIPLHLTEDRWVSAIEVRPAARAVVHHILFFLDDTGHARAQDGKTDTPGFGGMNLRNSGTLGGWAVGQVARRLPEDLAMALPKESDLVLQTHFHPSGKLERETTTIGIHFAKKPPTRSLLPLQLPAFFGRFANLDIPPGEKAFKIRGSKKLPVDVDLISVGGHAHFVCKSMTAVAKLPDGTTRKVFGISAWDFDWQGRYTWAKPPRLPKGSTLEAELVYDNSDDNPNNPNRPPKRITWGLQSTDEMGAITFVVSPAKESDVDELRRAIGPGVFKASLVGPGGRIRRDGERGANLELTLTDLDGKSHAPLTVDPGRAAVMVFIMNDCPISNSYAPELAALGKDLAAKGVPFYLVHVDRELSVEKAAAHAKEYSLPSPILRDPNRALVRAVGATVAPEAAVIAHGGSVAYLGRIDDRNPALGVRRPEATTRDLRDAIDAVLAGKTVENARTKAVGCIIE